MSLWQGILLGLVQGLTEFLPVSSDGHLAVIGHVAGVHTPGVFVEVALHVATLGSILVVYGGRFWRLALDVLRRQPEALRYAGLLIIGMIPAGLVGIFLEHLIERAFESLWAAGIGFLITGACLWSTRHKGPEGAAQPTPGGALIIGLAQAFAPLPEPVVIDLLLEQGQKAAARAVAKQGDADRHVGEVVPLDDREEAGQQHLVGKRAGGNEADGGWRGARADVPPLFVACDLRSQAPNSSLGWARA